MLGSERNEGSSVSRSLWFCFSFVCAVFLKPFWFWFLFLFSLTISPTISFFLSFLCARRRPNSLSLFNPVGKEEKNISHFIIFYFLKTKNHCWKKSLSLITSLSSISHILRKGNNIANLLLFFFSFFFNFFVFNFGFILLLS